MADRPRRVRWAPRDGAPTTAPRLDTSFGPSSSWPRTEATAQLCMPSRRIPLAPRTGQRLRPASAKPAAGVKSVEVAVPRPASAPTARGDSGSSAALPPPVPAEALPTEALPPRRPKNNALLADAARRTWESRMVTKAAAAAARNPNRTRDSAGPEHPALQAVLGEEEERDEPPSQPYRRRRRPRSAPGGRARAARRVRPASAPLRSLPEAATAAAAAASASPLNSSSWLSTSRTRLAPQAPPPTSAAAARLWHGLCDCGPTLRARHVSTPGPAGDYMRSSGLQVARRAAFQRSVLAEVGSGAIVSLVLARKRLAFACQLLPPSRTAAAPPAAPRLTRAEMVAERSARLDVLQGEEAKWTQALTSAREELRRLEAAVEAMEAIELELQRSTAALDIELWSARLEDRDGEAVSAATYTSAERLAAGRAAFRAGCLAARGRCYLLLGNAADALADFEGAVAAGVGPGLLEGLWGKAETLECLGRQAESNEARAKHDKLLQKQPEPPEPEPEPGRPKELERAGMCVSGVAPEERAELVRAFFTAGLPALHRLSADDGARRVYASGGGHLAAKWIGAKRLLILRAWQRWASGRVIFRGEVNRVLGDARTLLTPQSKAPSGQAKSSPQGASEYFVASELPVAQLFREQLLYDELRAAAKAAAPAAQEEEWSPGARSGLELVGAQAMVAERKLAEARKCQQKAKELQGRMVQAHGAGIHTQINAMRQVATGRAAQCRGALKTAQVALTQIQREAQTLSAVSTADAGGGGTGNLKPMGALFWAVMKSGLQRNADDAADPDDGDAPRFASVAEAVSAMTTDAASPKPRKERESLGPRAGTLDMELVRRLCGMLDFSLVWRFHPAFDAAAPMGMALGKMERALALSDLGVTPGWRGRSCWRLLGPVLARRVLAFCSPPALAAAGGTCRLLRGTVRNSRWDAWAAIGAQARAAAAPQAVNGEGSRLRTAALMATTKRQLLGLDAMDVYAASLDNYPPALLELVAEAVGQLIVSEDDGVAPAQSTEGSGTSLAFLFAEKPESLWTERSSSGASEWGSVFSQDSLTIGADTALQGWWREGGQYGQPAAESRWTGGREALRTLVKSRLLELHQPGSGVAFAALRTRPNLWRTIRRLLPYVAVLLAELPRAGRSTSAERIAAAVGYFVVATDSQLRDWCGMPTDPEAVWAEAHRARLHEMCARVQGVSGE